MSFLRKSEKKKNKSKEQKKGKNENKNESKKSPKLKTTTNTKASTKKKNPNIVKINSIPSKTENSNEKDLFFEQQFENDPDILSQTPPTGNDDKFFMKDDITRFFQRNKRIKQLEKHRTISFKDGFDPLNKRRGLKIDMSTTERDSRVEFSRMLGSKVRKLDVKKKGSEKKKIANKFLYDEKNPVVATPEPATPKIPSTTVTFVGGSKNKSDGKKKHVRKSNAKGFSLRFDTLRIDKILSGKFFEKKFENKSQKGIKNQLKKYKKQLEEDRRIVLKKIDQINRRIEKNKKELNDGIKVYHNNGLLSLMHYFRKLNVNKHLLLECKNKINIRSKEIINKRIVLIDNALNSNDKTLPFYIQECFFTSTNKLLSSLMECEDAMKVKRLKFLITQMEKIYQIERKIQAKALNKKETKKQLHELVKNCRDSYVEKEMENFEECVFQDEIQDRFNKIVRDIRTTQGESISNFLSAIENFGGLRSGKIPPYEITTYIKEFVLLLKKLYKFDDKRDIRVLGQLSNRLYFSIIGNELLELEYKAQSQKSIDDFVMKQTRLRNLDDDQLGMDSKFLDASPDDPKYSPYKKACDVLSNMEFCVTPNDMVWAIHCCYKMVIAEANAMCKKNNKKWSFGADELLPIIIYVLVHSDVPYITPLLSYISKFGTEKSSEVEYCLTCFEGATIYIQEFDMKKLKEIEEKNEKKRALERKKRNKKNKKKRLGAVGGKKKGMIKKLINFLQKGGKKGDG